VVAGRIVELGDGAGGRFVLDANVEHGDDGCAGGGSATGVRAAHEGQTARREEAGRMPALRGQGSAKGRPGSG